MRFQPLEPLGVRLDYELATIGTGDGPLNFAVGSKMLAYYTHLTFNEPVNSNTNGQLAQYPGQRESRPVYGRLEKNRRGRRNGTIEAVPAVRLCALISTYCQLHSMPLKDTKVRALTGIYTTREQTCRILPNAERERK